MIVHGADFEPDLQTDKCFIMFLRVFIKTLFAL